MAEPSRKPLVSYLQVQGSLDREVLRMLRHSAQQIERQLNQLEDLDRQTVSQRIRTAQLRQARVAIKQQIGDTMDQVAGEIRNKRSEVAAAAGNVLADTTVIFAAAGFTVAEIRVIKESMVRSAQQNVTAAVARMQGLSYVPLSSRVYKTKQLINGQVSKIIQEHLAKGSSARDLARDVRSFIRPSVRGGVRYAAMRLARTELNNAFHAVSIKQGQECPFVDGMRWHLSGSHPKPDECNDYAEKVFEPDDVPSKPHPNCLCYVAYVTPSREDFVANFRAGKYDSWLDDQGLGKIADDHVA